MTKKLLFILYIGVGSFSFAQESDFSEEELAVKKTIDQVFEGMLKGDSALVHNSFHSSSRLMTCYIGRDGKGHVIEDPLDDFLLAIADVKENEWQEKIISFSIFIDLNLAQVWTNYEFYLNDKFSHCGVNAFQLVKENDVWKIIQLTDTRKVENCQ